uniref:Uncharacterized protein n=1 Tax=Caenorhabditis japonica TaxID=281687 RepID=A0A8R1DMN5_CAEJA
MLIQFFHSLIPLVVHDKCSLIINKNLYKFGHVPILIFMTTPMFFPFSITVERFHATMSAEKYEKTRVRLGPILFFTTIFICLSLITYIYKDEPFEAGSVSFSFIPASTINKMFNYYWFLLVLNTISFLLNLLLLRQNREMKKKEIPKSEAPESKVVRIRIAPESETARIRSARIRTVTNLNWYKSQPPESTTPESVVVRIRNSINQKCPNQKWYESGVIQRELAD